MYTARVSESCLVIHGCAWLPPDDPGVIAQLILDAEAGISVGPVTVTVTIRDGAPPAEVDESDDAAELSVFAANQPAFVGGFADAALPDRRIDRSGPGWYRLRVRATGQLATEVRTGSVWSPV